VWHLAASRSSPEIGEEPKTFPLPPQLKELGTRLVVKITLQDCSDVDANWIDASVIGIGDRGGHFGRRYASHRRLNDR